uniref:AAA+ ATPase domain-containing protein n=1 Tax=viral metagenome TaxID=1070528 RepID=A0A6C0I3Y4_9ZZZZ
MSLSKEQEEALEKFKNGENLFITGPGGTGKTKLISHFVEHIQSTKKVVPVCAMTGCAALLLNCNARTLHSWSGIKLARGDHDSVVASVLKNKHAVKLWKQASGLIVDEVSMLSKKLFDILEEIARRVKKSAQPFGNMQVIFTGDFYQLPPVGTDGEPDTSQFCFESSKWSSVFRPENHIELVTMFRQSDPEYIAILQQIRRGSLDEEKRQVLQSYVKREFVEEEHNGCIPTKLFPLRAQADYVNNTMFAKIKESEVVFEMVKRNNCRAYLDNEKPIPKDILLACSHLTAKEIDYEMSQMVAQSPAPQMLRIKKGAAVMCVMNLDMENGICNGSQGVVIDINGAGLPIVKFSNGLTKTIGMQWWQSEDFPTIAIGQVPLALAWAMTIHKIQGATVDMAEMDLGNGIFECGQTYVALSRIKSLNGLYLSAFHAQRIRANAKVTEFYQQMSSYKVESEEKEKEKEKEKRESEEKGESEKKEKGESEEKEKGESENKVKKVLNIFSKYEYPNVIKKLNL